MKFIRQLSIILFISFIGELLGFLLPFPIPASIYGLVLMLLCLCFKIIKVEQVKGASDFLIEIMPLMFIPATVGIMESYVSLKNILIPVIIAITVVTAVVMAVSCVVTQAVISRSDCKKEVEKND